MIITEITFSQKTVRDLVNPERNATFLQNKWIKVGASLDIGGAITFLSDVKKNENLINNHDWGRQIQMSFYGGPNPYMPDGKEPNPAWKFLGWNPIQSGDWAGNRSKVIAYKNDGKQIYIKCIPMQWPLDSVPGECIFESWISLKKNTVEVISRINNFRKDKIQYEARSQELPAIYTNAPYSRLVTYTGPRPFSNDTVSDIDNENAPPVKKIKWASWQATENWAATLNKDDWGLGVYNASAQDFIGGFFGKKGVQGGSKDSPTAYISPLNKDILDHNITYTYRYVLILGTLEEIRAYVYKKAKNKLPAYNFKNDRQHWLYKNITDAGWPIKGYLGLVTEREDAALISPNTIWNAELQHHLIIEAAYNGAATQAKIYIKPFGANGYTEDNSLAFNLKPGGKFVKYRLPLNEIKGYRGFITGLKIMPPVNIKSDTALLKIKSISVR